MALNPIVTIVVCTRNRATGLRRTLASLQRCTIPVNWDVEAIVVDNASTDNTEEVIRAANLRNMAVKYVYEPAIGLSHARNSGLAHMKGNIVLFTDDDVQVERNWIFELASPMLNDDCDAVTGQVTIAPSLVRPWMTRMHKGWLASSIDAQMPAGPVSLVGANMAFRSSVLATVPSFDPELGAGALGAGEDTLFGLQLIEAGFRIEFNDKARVVHEFDSFRLLRQYWLKDAVKRGRSSAYILYHWEHGRIEYPRLESLSYQARLHLRRCIQPPASLQSEGCDPWEMSYVSNIEKCRQFRIESQRPRLYQYHALKRVQWSAVKAPISVGGQALP